MPVVVLAQVTACRGRRHRRCQLVLVSMLVPVLVPVLALAPAPAPLPPETRRLRPRSAEVSG